VYLFVWIVGSLYSDGVGKGKKIVLAVKENVSALSFCTEKGF
jgi:hypothetical protein